MIRVIRLIEVPLFVIAMIIVLMIIRPIRWIFVGRYFLTSEEINKSLMFKWFCRLNPEE